MSLLQIKAKPTDFFENSDLPRLKGAHFRFFQELILETAGIRLLENKKSLVTTRLGRRLRVHGLKSWDEYILLLKARDPEEMKEFTNVLTTNKTEFFREMKHFDYLRDRFLPELLNSGIEEPTFWVAASSYGHEVYSLVMILEEFNRVQQSSLKAKILATDIDTKVLDQAAGGIFDQESVETKVNALLRKRYFLAGRGANAGLYKFTSEIQQSLKFRQHNLCDDTDQMRLTFDMIMLRNVLIYFKPETVAQVISKMVGHLRPGGLLILGHCETILEMKWPLETVAQSVYRKKGAE